jgi:hypothetical protein
MRRYSGVGVSKRKEVHSMVEEQTEQTQEGKIYTMVVGVLMVALLLFGFLSLMGVFR